MNATKKLLPKPQLKAPLVWGDYLSPSQLVVGDEISFAGRDGFFGNGSFVSSIPPFSAIIHKVNRKTFQWHTGPEWIKDGDLWIRKTPIDRLDGGRCCRGHVIHRIVVA